MFKGLPALALFPPFRAGNFNFLPLPMAVYQFELTLSLARNFALNDYYASFGNYFLGVDNGDDY